MRRGRWKIATWCQWGKIKQQFWHRRYNQGGLPNLSLIFPLNNLCNILLVAFLSLSFASVALVTLSLRQCLRWRTFWVGCTKTRVSGLQQKTLTFIPYLNMLLLLKRLRLPPHVLTPCTAIAAPLGDRPTSIIIYRILGVMIGEDILRFSQSGVTLGKSPAFRRKSPYNCMIINLMLTDKILKIYLELVY